MGIFSDVGNFWVKNVAPITLPIAGGAIGGPGGAAAGANLAGAMQPKPSSGPTDADIWATNRNAELQKEFAQNGIRWKVADSIAAGIHPLVGLGAPSTNFSPIGIGGGSTAPRSDLSDMGQNISRAIQATRTADERELAVLQMQSARLDVEGKSIDNQIRLSSLRQMTATGPSLPGSDRFIPGQGDSGRRILEKPMERTKTLQGAPHSEPGAIPDVGWVKTPTGVVPVPSKDAKERTEDVMPHEWMHYFRNNVLPNFGAGPKPPNSALPKGYDYWRWNRLQQEFQPRKKSDDRDRFKEQREQIINKYYRR